MKSLIGLVFLPIIVALIGMIAFGEILGYTIVAIITFVFIKKKGKR